MGWKLNVLALLSLGLIASASAVQIVTEGPNVACEEFDLSGELKVYKDPTLFLGNLSLFHRDREAGWESLMEENPLLTTVTGNIKLMRLAPPRAFRGFGIIARLYERFEPRLKANKLKARKTAKETPLIVPVKVCGGEQGYAESLGFILQEDLLEAQRERNESQGLPPSTLANRIPELPEDLAQASKNNSLRE